MGHDAEQSRLWLRALGERESGTARLDEAVAALREALQENTRDHVPLGWAMSTGNQGVACILTSGHKKEPQMRQP